MNTKLHIVAMGTLLASCASAQLLSDDFESDTVGEKPATAAVVRPTANTEDLYTMVVDSSVNTAGSGKGTRLYDNGTDGGVVLSYNFVDDADSQLSAVRADFNFSCLNSGGSGVQFISVTFASYSTALSIGSSSARFSDCRLFDDGTIDIRSASGSSKTGTEISAGSHSLSIFANDFSSSIAYTAPDGSVQTLAADSVDYWLDSALLHSTSLDLSDTTAEGTVGTTEGNLGKFGFISTSSQTNLDFVVDDFVFTSLEGVQPTVDYLISDTFESDTVGDLPVSPGVVRPYDIVSDVFNKVVDSSVNTAGSGNAAQLYDDDPASSVVMEYNFVADADSQISVVRADFAFSCLDASGAGDYYIATAFGAYSTSASFGSTVNSFTLARLYNDGTIDFTSASGASSTGHDVSTGSHQVSIFVNDHDTQSVNYTGPDNSAYVLPTNSVAYWLDGQLITTTLMDLDDVTAGGTLGTSEGNLGKFGFSTGSKQTNINYVVDNILVTTNLSVDSFNEWVALFPGMGSSNGLSDDPDQDGMENLLEYALGGNPLIDDVAAVQPACILDNAGGWLNYLYNRRVDDDSLTYEVKVGETLGSTFTGTAEEAGATDLGNGFETVTNRISTTVNPAGFMQLEVSQ